jgi:hypothetical protein
MEMMCGKKRMEIKPLAGFQSHHFLFIYKILSLLLFKTLISKCLTHENSTGWDCGMRFQILELHKGILHETKADSISTPALHQRH